MEKREEIMEKQRSGLFFEPRSWALLCTAVCALWAGPASADWTPTRNVEVIVSSAPGGGQDLTARTLARALQEAGVTTVVRNMPGGGGTIAWGYLNQQEGDGHYISLSTGRLITSYLEGVTDIGPEDVTPLAIVYTEYAFFTVAADSDIRDADDLVARLRDNPGAISIYSGVGLGNPGHIAVSMMAEAADVDPRQLSIVSFDSGAEAMAALLGGHIDLQVSTGVAVIPRLEEGSVRVVGVAAPERLADEGVVSEIPTWIEQGYNFVADRSTIIFGPTGLSEDQIAYWDEALGKALATEEWREVARANYRSESFLGRNETVEFIEGETQRLGRILRTLGLAE